jgi:hypothetical protein
MSNPISLNENAVREVLARAVELEREHGGALTETQVRDIARELFIPRAAIDQALAEYRNGASNRIAARASSRSSRSRLVLAAIVGIAIIGLALAFITLRIVP